MTGIEGAAGVVGAPAVPGITSSDRAIAVRHAQPMDGIMRPSYVRSVAAAGIIAWPAESMESRVAEKEARPGNLWVTCGSQRWD